MLISIRSVVACSANDESIIWHKRCDRLFLQYVTAVVVSMSCIGEVNSNIHLPALFDLNSVFESHTWPDQIVVFCALCQS